jgi:hypothetical protein
MLLGAMSLLWLFSPLIPGYWVGQRLAQLGYQIGPLPALLSGVLLIVLVVRVISIIPCLGTLVAGVIYLICFALTLGSLIVGRRQPSTPVLEA